MADLWIQVETTFPRSKLVDAAVRELGLDRDQAMGKLVRLWLAVMEDRRGGNLADRTDSWIEEEVGWRGEPGRFAGFIRQYHLDETGMIRDWPEKYGKLEQTRAHFRAKKQQQRSASRGHGGVVVPETVPKTPQGTEAAFRADVPDDVSEKVSTTLTSSALSSYQGPENGRDTARAKLADPLDAPEFPDLAPLGDSKPHAQGLLRASRSPLAVAQTIMGWLTETPDHKPVTPAVLARAVREYAANETQFRARLFGGYVRDAERAMQGDRGRVALAHERQHIDTEAVQRERDDREAAEMLRMAEAFERDEPERFAELKAEAERKCTYKGMMRDEMVRGALLSLIRHEVSNV